MSVRLLALMSAVLMLAQAGQTSAQDQWNQFIGPAGSGIAPDADSLPAEFNASTNQRWSCAIPPGYSSPCIWGDRIFLTGATDREVQTICIDRATGAILWTRETLTDMFESRHRINSPATTTAISTSPGGTK